MHFAIKHIITSLGIQVLFLIAGEAQLMAGDIPLKYAITTSDIPVFNSPVPAAILGSGAGKIATDRCGQPRELEFIALQGTVFIISQILSGKYSGVLKVTSDEYPYATPHGLYIDKRFLRISDTPSPSRKKVLPGMGEIINRLREMEGTKYLWGGNVSSGLVYKKEEPAASGKTGKESRLLAGVDCSGLLYEATGGWTPRNSSSLAAFGEAVDIEGLSPNQLMSRLRPLDLIVWPGHVLVFIDNGEIIESRLSCNGGKSGVVIERASERLKEITRSRKPLNSLSSGLSDKKAFTVRRWFALPR